MGLAKICYTGYPVIAMYSRHSEGYTQFELGDYNIFPLVNLYRAMLSTYYLICWEALMKSICTHSHAKHVCLNYLCSQPIMHSHPSSSVPACAVWSESYAVRYTFIKGNYTWSHCRTISSSIWAKTALLRLEQAGHGRYAGHHITGSETHWLASDTSSYDIHWDTSVLQCTNVNVIVKHSKQHKFTWSEAYSSSH